MLKSGASDSTIAISRSKLIHGWQ